MFRQYLNLGRLSAQTPQTEPIPGTNQVQNHAGGYSWSVDDRTRLHRFLILGSSSGSYYVGSRTLTKENLFVVERLLKDGKGREIIDAIVEVSQAGRASSNDPALFALARCAASDDQEIRQYALSVLPLVARTGTHILHFVAFVKQFRGWGRAYRTAIASWFNTMDASKLAYQAMKYQQRDGYSQRDLLRLAHPKAQDETHQALFHWIVKGWPDVGDHPHPDEALRQIWAFEHLKKTLDSLSAAALIQEYKLPRETVPTLFLRSKSVWQALLRDMPLEAMTRNLATMTKEDVLVPLSDATTLVVDRLHDREVMKRARLHPIKLLAAVTTYQSGHGVKGTNTWTPLRAITDALNDAFYLAFDAIEPTGKRILLAIDTSGSMHGSQVNGIEGMSLHTACAAMAMAIVRTERNFHIIGVDTGVQELSISPTQRLDDVTNILSRIGGGGTDLSLPMLYALQKKIVVDAFVILTDNETWAGRSHPVQALKLYRQALNPEARLINVQMAATQTTNNDPDDRLALECVGFDTAVPAIISEFLNGNV